MSTSTHPAQDGGPRRPALARALKVLTGLVPLLAALACLPFLAHTDARQVGLAAALGLLYVVAFRNEFQTSRGSAVPTEPVVVAMALALPPAWIPPLGLVAVTLGSIGLDLAAPSAAQRAVTTFRSAWNLVVLAGALWAAPLLAPDLPPAALVAVAVATQILGDAAQVLAIEHAEAAARQVLRPLAWTYAVDALLAVVGYCIVTTTGPGLPRIGLVITPILLLRLLARDRRQYFQEARTLHSAYTEVNHEARRDPMTGLLNRRGWEEVLEQTTAYLASSPKPCTATVLVADLDRLKYANDTYGHLAGDALICAFADLLTDVAPPDAAIARLGGDEFAMLVTGPTDAGSVDLFGLVRRTVLAALPVGAVQMSASLGQATYPPAPDLEAAVQSADDAARVDKEMRRMTREDVPRSA